MYNPITNSNVISCSNQIRQLYSQRAINNSQAQQQLQQQQQIITTPQTQQSYSDQSVYSGFTNTQQRKALRNVRPIVTTPATETIDLSTPPSSPVPSSVPETSLLPNIGWEFMKITERMLLQESSIIAAYKVNNILRLIEVIGA